jgi:hypothetical protein
MREGEGENEGEGRENGRECVGKGVLWALRGKESRALIAVR